MKIVLPTLLLLAAATLFFYKKVQPHKHNPYSTANSPENQLPADSLGYRFVVLGDFDGDGAKDTLTESYTDSLTNNEISKIRYYNGDDRIGFLVQKKSILQLKSNTTKISPFILENKHHNTSGLLFVKNIGNIDTFAGDEISYTIDWLDFSGVNHFYIAGFHQGKWHEIGGFPMHEYAVEIFDDNGVNEDSLAKWNGFVERLKNGKTHIFTEKQVDDFGDTIIVKDFRK